MDQIGGGLMPQEQTYTVALTNHNTRASKTRRLKRTIQEGKGLKRTKKRVSKPKATTEKTTPKKKRRKRKQKCICKTPKKKKSKKSQKQKKKKKTTKRKKKTSK